MADKQTPISRELDDQLAEFTDRLLGEDQLNSVDPEVKDPALLELQQIAVSLKRAMGYEQPEADLAQRINTALETEWQDMARSSKRNLSWLERFKLRQPTWTSTSSRNRALTVVFAAISIALIFFFITNSGTGPILTGASYGQNNLIPILFALLIVLGVVFLVARNKK